MESILITTQFEGFHKYPKAPKEVAFLRSLHRHLFHVKVQIEVFSDSRDIEFFIFKRQVQEIIDKHVSKLKDDRSCESIGKTILNGVLALYKDRRIEVSIGEDQENYSVINNYE